MCGDIFYVVTEMEAIFFPPCDCLHLSASVNLCFTYTAWNECLISHISAHIQSRLGVLNSGFGLLFTLI